MAHADVFRRIEKNPAAKQEAKMDKKAVETIKILSKQVLEIREIMNKQTSIIKKLQQEVTLLRTKASETEGNIKLTMIDQKDISKQLRNIKSTVNGEQLVGSRIINNEAPHPDSTRFNDEPAMEPSIDDENLAKKFYQGIDHSQVLSVVDRNQIEQDGFPSLDDVFEPASATQSQQAVAHATKTRDAEHVAKEFIFGRIPKLLNLD